MLGGDGGLLGGGLDEGFPRAVQCEAVGGWLGAGAKGDADEGEEKTFPIHDGELTSECGGQEGNSSGKKGLSRALVGRGGGEWVGWLGYWHRA